MYDELDRSAVKALRRRGESYSEIARQMGCDRKTVKRILSRPTDETYERESPGSQVDRFKEQIEIWFKTAVPVERMLELAREGEPPYEGSRSAFFARVKQFRQAWDQARADCFVRFEGLPGEYAQVDWGLVASRHPITPSRASPPRFTVAMCVRLHPSVASPGTCTPRVLVGQTTPVKHTLRETHLPIDRKELPTKQNGQSGYCARELTANTCI